MASSAQQLPRANSARIVVSRMAVGTSRAAMGPTTSRRVALLASTLLLLACPRASASSRRRDDGAFTEAERRDALARVDRMFYHGYDNYMAHAFPHDELKPITRTWTDSLGELGNLNREHLSSTYEGVALTLIDATSTLAVVGNVSEFRRAVSWLETNLDFDVDVRVNAFECNIRVLGGLLSAHVLALGDSRSWGPARGAGRGGWLPGGGKRASAFARDDGAGFSVGAPLAPAYSGGLLDKALDLGERLLRAFDTETGMPYAWVNLRDGVRAGETTETNVAAVGSFALEFGTLSRLSGDDRFELAAKRAVRALWSMRSDLDLLGNTLDVRRGTWINRSGGVGAGCDSFFEYLLKAHVMFGDDEYLDIFRDAYAAAMRYYHEDGWYHEAHMMTGVTTHAQATALQAFWPGMQVMAGDVEAAAGTHARLYSVWRKYGVFPERFMYREDALHPSEKYYPLRPELAESTAMLWFATGDDSYRRAGARIAEDIERHTRVEGGHAAVRDVETMTLEDHMHSFFLAETCKYLHLLFDDSFLEGRNVVFSTEGHPLPVFARRDDEDAAENAAENAAASGRDGDEETSQDPRAPFESREFVRVVESAVAEAKRRARRERGIAGDDARVEEAMRVTSTTAAALGASPCSDSDSSASASPDERYRPRLADPSSAMRDPRHAGAGWGATARVCPNLRVIGTAVAAETCDAAAAAASAAGTETPAEKLARLAETVERLRLAWTRREAIEEDAARTAGGASDRAARKKRKDEPSSASGSGSDSDSGSGSSSRSPVSEPPEPRASRRGTESACHVLDRDPRHACVRDGDCGVDAETCAPRKCSTHRFCYTAK